MKAIEGLLILILIRNVRSLARSKTISQCVHRSSVKSGTMFYTFFLSQHTLRYIVPEHRLE